MTAASDIEAIVLLTLPSASLTTADKPKPYTYTGPLALECVTLPPQTLSASSDAGDADTLLVLRVGGFETVLDPTHAVRAFLDPSSGEHRYTLRGSGERDDLELVVRPEQHADEVETLHLILNAYGHSLREDAAKAPAMGTAITPSHDTKVSLDAPVADPSLRGRFVLVDANSHEVISRLDDSVRVQEDPVIYEKGHEHDPVVVEVEEREDKAGLSDREQADLDELKEANVLVSAIPDGERGWMLSGAVFACHVISSTTTLLSTAMTSASSFYIAHSTPSPHANPSTPAPGTPVPPPSRMLLLLQSPTTKKNLGYLRTATGQAVKLSGKAAGLVNSLVDRAVGNAPQPKGKASPAPIPSGSRPSLEGKPPLPARPNSTGPLPHAGSSTLLDEKALLYPRDDKPALPPRRSPSPFSSKGSTAYHTPATAGTLSPASAGAYTQSPARLSSPSRSPSPAPPVPPRHPTLARLALSASLVLTTLSTSATSLIATGSTALSDAVTHKYGREAGENVSIAGGAARDVVLVYVDVRGMGRRAVVRRAVKGVVKGRVRKSAAPQPA